jgi:hypothetical protein
MRFATALLLSAVLASTTLGLPAPSEYTTAMFAADLQAAHLVAQVRVVSLDTSARMEHVVLKVLSVYKGGLNGVDSLVHDSRNLDMVGWYEPGYAVGQRSIVCCADAAKDGVNLRVNSRGKYAIGVGDSVQPPPTGLGFSAEFAGHELLANFEGLLASVITDNQFLQFAPVLPRSTQAITFRTLFMMGGGDVINSLAIDQPVGTNTLRFTITYTPCTGVCPNSIRLVDTSAVLNSLPAGTYTAYRYMENSLIDPPFVLPDDSVTFTVYATSAVGPVARPTRALPRLSDGSHASYDCSGRAVRARQGALPAGIYLHDGHGIVRTDR